MAERDPRLDPRAGDMLRRRKVGGEGEQAAAEQATDVRRIVDARFREALEQGIHDEQAEAARRLLAEGLGQFVAVL